MKKHITAYLFLVFVLVACSQGNKKTPNKFPINKLENTTWLFEVAENCIDSIRFLSTEKFLYYYCGAGFIYDGNYTHTGDTIYSEILDDVNRADPSQGRSPTCKLDFKYENNQLCVVKKWEEYSLFLHLYRTQCFYILQK